MLPGFDAIALDALTSQQQDGYPPICPDFVVELRSPTDSLEDLRAKMQEYLNNGAWLGWLINQASFPGEASPGNVAPQDKQVEIYRQGQEVEVLKSPISVSGEDILLGFVLDLHGII